MSFNAIRENKIFMKISESTVTICPTTPSEVKLTEQPSLNLLASAGVVKLRPHSLCVAKSLQWTKHSVAGHRMVPGNYRTIYRGSYVRDHFSEFNEFNMK